MADGLIVVPDPTGVSWESGVIVFLRTRDLASTTRRVYKLVLDALGGFLGPAELASLTTGPLALAMGEAWPAVAPATWNRNLTVVRSFLAFARRQGWLDHDPAAGLERRRVPEDYGRILTTEELDRLFSKRSASVRDRCLWVLLYESAARAEEVLRLNVEDLDLPRRRAVTIRKGGDTDVLHWATRSARLLPTVIGGRTSGPLFLARGRPHVGREPALRDIDAATGRARLSYRRAAETFKRSSGGATLHSLRRSAITHLAEEGVPTVLLMAKSRHASLRTLQRYARPSVDAVARLTAEHDPVRR